MTYTQIRLDVADYTKWRAGFEASAPARRAYGATGNNQVFHDRESPNTVTAIVEWEDAKRAHEWFESPAMKEAQQKAGVKKVLENHLLERA